MPFNATVHFHGIEYVQHCGHVFTMHPYAELVDGGVSNLIQATEHPVVGWRSWLDPEAYFTWRHIYLPMDRHRIWHVLVPCPRPVSDGGRSLRSYLDKVCTEMSLYLMKITDMISPAPEIPQPFHLISDDENDIEAMRKAEQDPKLVILSDWSHYTSEEYQTIMEESGVDLLYEPRY